MADTPNVRFEGFTEDWTERKLSTIITEKLSNGVINKFGTEDSNVKHINVINMYTSDRIHTENLASSSYDENIIQKCNVEVGDIFMTRSSLKPEGIAEANVLLDSGRYVFDDHLIRMKVDKLKYDPVFVKINLGNRMIKTQFIMKSKTTAFTTIGQEDISECKGMFPCLEEQKKIGEYFQNLGHLITLHQRKGDETKELKKYMLQKMFPQNGKKIPEIRFAGFTGDWEQRKLNVIADVRDGTHDSPQYVNEGHPFVTSKNVKDGYINYENIQFISDKDYEEINKRSQVEKNDILMGMIGTIGNIALVREIPDFAIKNVALIKDTGQILYLYLYHCLQSTSVVNQLSENLDGGTQKFIALNKIRELDITIPSRDEQHKIGTYMEYLDTLITLHQRKCDELKEVRKFMLQNMFPQKG